jgi:hypothetical protein
MTEAGVCVPAAPSRYANPSAKAGNFERTETMS